MKISACVITYNEEVGIERCLRPLFEIADEVIVVDSHSTDRTAEICRSLGARVVQRPFAGHIEQKQYAITLAANDFVLSVDADEVVSPELIDSIRKIKSVEPATAFVFDRRTFYAGRWIRHCGWYPDPKVRLWDKSVGKWGGTNPHDKVVLDVHVKTIKLHGYLDHYSYQSIAHHVEKINFLTTISAEEAFKKGKKSSLLKIACIPVFDFFKDYLFKQGFRDGYYGFVICFNAGYSKFLKYAKLRDLWRKFGAPKD